jgi:hypothetical protein
MTPVCLRFIYESGEIGLFRQAPISGLYSGRFQRLQFQNLTFWNWLFYEFLTGYNPFTKVFIIFY